MSQEELSKCLRRIKTIKANPSDIIRCFFEEKSKLFKNKNTENTFDTFVNFLAMKWYSTKSDTLPQDKQAVIVRLNDEEFETIFVQSTKLFICTKKPGQAFNPKFENFYWAVRPNN